MFSLQPLLSTDSAITEPLQPLRWSAYKAPHPAFVVHPATALDVSKTVQWANENNVSFLVQSGGNGWASTFSLDSQGILIQLDKLRSVTFNQDGTQATIGGGALFSDIVVAAAAKSTLALAGTCNSVGALGAILGGGYSNLSGQFGLGVDDILSLDIVKADGELITLSSAALTSEAEKDLFWAMRGAGPNFGIVTSAVLRTHPVSKEDLFAWTGALTFAPSQLEDVLNAIQSISFGPKMALSFNFLNLGAPTILVTPFFHGSTETGRLAFKPLLDVGPSSDGTRDVPYENWNAGSDIACIKGGRRPTIGVGLASLDLVSWRNVFNTWAELIQQPGAERSSVLLNAIPMDKARTLLESSSAFPFRRGVNFHATFTAAYADPAFDASALEYVKKARGIWQSADGLENHSTYINNAFGDEPLETVYGQNLQKLKSIKKQVDPKNRFNQWFSLF
ncbi:FAD binding domain-containing protein [Periconia macrospinosa]|uniref:FAD binding domain-containing protein n=1 Tax=Periconia macrospinosa TaxID=97972 RepID=A0A2V1DXZ2_9PLEO|nr:FAD binding domain-containing protein [Periconia macrospinosa]